MTRSSFVAKGTALAVAAVVLAAVWAAVAFSAPAVSASTHARYSDFKHAGPVGSAREAVTPKLLNIKWRPGVPEVQQRAAAAKLGFKIVQSSARLGWTQVQPTLRGLTVSGLEKRMRAAGLVQVAQPAVIYQPADLAPNDPMFADQWALKNIGQLGGTPGSDIGATRAWDTTAGSNVIVAVVDEGVNWQHPDLAANMWVNTKEIPNNGIDDDNNGYVDDVRGWDFYNDDNTVYDRVDGDRHGTHVSGIIGAAGNNATGVAGVNWHVRIMPVKFLGPYGGDDFSGAMAIEYAVDNGARVINCSWGGQGVSDVLSQAIDYAAQHGVLIVCAAGNDGVSIDSTPFFPASSDATNVITVAATDRNDQLPWWSNVGAEGVDLAAPGVDITSTLPRDLAGFYIDSPPYKLMYLPIQAESLEPSSARDAIIARSVARVGGLPSTPILVVDGSRSTETSEVPGQRLAVYTSALSSAGYTNVTTWNTETQGSPSATATAGKVLVWFTGKESWGWYNTGSITASDEAAIGAYLDNGGRMVMASGELATDCLYFGLTDSSPDWFHQYFQCDLIDYMTWTLDFTGKPQTPFEGLSAHLPAAYNNSDDPSQLWPTGSDDVVPLTFTSDSGPGGPAGGNGATRINLATVADTPGVWTQFNTGDYGPLSGTSMAAPHVTGSVALLAAAFPTATPEELRARIIGTADLVPGLDGKVASGGRLDVAAALGKFAGAPIIDSPKTGGHLHAGVPTPLVWHMPPSSDPGATFTAQIGLPYTVWAEGFESGTLGALDVTGDAPWAASNDATATHCGSWGARSGVLPPAISLGGGWFQGTASEMDTTITVPEGGGNLSFWWKLNTPDWAQAAEFYVDDGQIGDMLWNPADWTKDSFALPAGQHTLHWVFINFASAPSGSSFAAVDDIALTAHAFSDIGTATAGSTTLTFTPPVANTDDVVLRMRSATASRTSAWSYVNNLHISTDLTAPGPLAGFSAVSDGDGGVNLSWANPTDLDFSDVRIVRRADNTTPTGPNDPAATVAYEGTATSSVDGPFADGTRVRYAAYAEDFAGNWSAASYGSPVVFDTVAPAPVSLLSAEQADGAVSLSWIPPDPATYDRVVVMRRTDTTPTSPGDVRAEQVFSGPGALGVDFDLPPTAHTAYYSAWAVDKSGNLSAPVSLRMALDLVPPAGTMALDGGARFTANPVVSVDSSVTGATQMRIFPNGEIDEEALWQSYSPSASATLFSVDGSQSVTAQYRDDAGNVTQITDDIYIDLHTPDPPTGLVASNFNDGVRLNWNKGPDDSVVSFDVWRASSASGPWSKVKSAVPWSAAGLAIGHLPSGVPVHFALSANDGVGHHSALGDAADAVPGVGTVRVAGANRVDTALAGSQQHFTSAEAVVLVSATAPADALGAAPLAGAYGGPLLMTGGKSLESGVIDELNRLGATSVTIVGGTASVSAAEENALGSAGFEVDRIAGSDRYVVAAAVARRVVAETGRFDGTVIVASGEALADPISAGAIAYSQGIPILLTRASGAPQASVKAAQALGAQNALAVGGPTTLPEGSVTAIAPAWRRIGGASRYDVAVNLAEYAVSHGWAQWSFLGVGSGASPADALAGAAVAGSQHGVMLLTAPAALSGATDHELRKHASAIGRAEVFGSTSVIGANVQTQVNRAINAY